MGKNARENAKFYSPESISKLWTKLFNKITNDN